MKKVVYIAVLGLGAYSHFSLHAMENRGAAPVLEPSTATIIKALITAGIFTAAQLAVSDAKNAHYSFAFGMLTATTVAGLSIYAANVKPELRRNPTALLTACYLFLIAAGNVADGVSFK